MYYLYHIPGKKIGVTRNLNKRVTQTQGYKPNEYEVLDQSDDIDYISKRELELQTSYGYKVDIKPYKNLFKMKVNVTEQTTTFPVPLMKLKGRLHDQIGLNWQTEFGKIRMTTELADWIATNAHVSMYNSERSYEYNKTLWEAFNKMNSFESLVDQVETRTWTFDNIRDWAKQRGLYKKGDSKTQYVKLQEEAGELAKALLKNDKPEIKDAIGDIVVVLTNLAHLEKLTIEECIDAAYTEILNRKGKMINGTFVKDEL